MTLKETDIEKLNRLICDELSTIKNLEKVRVRIKQSIRRSREEIKRFQKLLDKYSNEVEKE